MLHDPRAQRVIERWAKDRAVDILDSLADAGLCVVSDAAEPADVEAVYDHLPGCCGLRGCQCGGCQCMERP